MPNDESGYTKNKIYEIPVSELKPDPNQPRKFFDKDAMDELQTSLAKHGIITPIIFRMDEKGNKIIMAGERRFKAAKKVNFDTIPGIFNDGDAAEIALVENLLRQDLTAVEEAEAMKRLKDEKEYTDEQLGEVIGKKRSTISDMLLITNLPEDVRKQARKDMRYSRREMIKIAREKTAKKMESSFKKYKTKLDKQKEQGGKRKKREPKETILSRDLIKIKERIENANSKYNIEERKAISEILEDLKVTIETFLKEK